MIDLLMQGDYKLLETKSDTKMLILTPKGGDVQTFAWIIAKEIGEILVTAKEEHEIQCILSVGKFNLYDVDDDPDLVDLPHLELEVGESVWQGYLLPTGLPTKTDKRNRIIPTEELVKT